MTHFFPAGMPRHLTYPAVAVPQILTSAADTYGQRSAVADGDDTLSYTGMLAGAQSIARFLTDQGVGPSSVVALHLPNVMHFFPAYYGALFTGAAVTLINPLQPAQGLAAQLLDAGADTIVTHPAHLAPVTEVVEQCGLRSVLVCDPTWSGPANADQLARAGKLCGTGPYVSLARVLDRPAPDFVPVLQDSDAVAHYAYTGGTTGRSKGVRVLHRNVIANVTQMAAWRLNSLVHAEPAEEAAAETSGERLVLRRIEGLPEPLVVPGADASIQVPPLFHAQGLATSNMFILGGVTIVLAGRFNPETFISLADKWQATYTSGNPPLFLALAEHCRRTGATIDSMRLAISGAAPLDSTALSRIAAVMPNAAVGEGYGLTEGTCMITSTSVLPGSPQHVGSVGVPVPDTHVQIRGVDGVTELPDGHEGELWVRGPQVTDGYSHAPEQTAAQFIDGWLRTGDIASKDADGFIRIHDRAKDMLIYKGYNVYPRELEDIAAAHPAVAGIAVVGRPAGDAGQIPVAFIEPVQDATLDEDEFLAWVAERVLPYQKIREVHVVEQLPISPTGKILKTELRDWL
ncbi:class I adenylate-forming enzyme family protein [Brevibacterium luteolum]|uniref:class I adenylate-forming enzyme family protein n=1 Tax=Brevibacterium luteolum TaxID=199591 RepID=UPI00223B5361|nr:AMP-binding protein [Brevibacterium luteolum]MCT1872601.1 AMP-binding protein [Brevibacterium luteolum]MCT1890574.1 AMP-binding protein [Brevibacterium luteolum]MCT1893064.1 AMP-binding protein [Brevibacterium luteolum]MCT1923856.1 AMP-binding protein [Brevibacterium luteolum]